MEKYPYDGDPANFVLLCYNFPFPIFYLCLLLIYEVWVVYCS